MSVVLAGIVAQLPDGLAVQSTIASQYLMLLWNLHRCDSSVLSGRNDKPPSFHNAGKSRSFAGDVIGNLIKSEIANRTKAQVRAPELATSRSRRTDTPPASDNDATIALVTGSRMR